MPNCKGKSSSAAAGEHDSLCSSGEFSAEELEVAEILLSLPDHIKESSHRCPSSRGVKKKRFLDSDSPARVSNSLPFTGNLEDVSTSPISPLAFPSCTESDRKLVFPKNEVSLGRKEGLFKRTKTLADAKEQLEKGSLVLPSSQSQSSIPLAPQPPRERRPLILFPYQQKGRTDFDLNHVPPDYTAELQ